jgi:hypothetical protein
MKSTTIRFADPVYERLEQASQATGLPINSIVVVACLDWLRDNRAGAVGFPVPPPVARGQMRRFLQSPVTISVGAQPRAGLKRGLVLAGSDPLHIFTASAQEALAQAQEEAARTRRWIGTEHLLHGLRGVEEARAAQVLGLVGVDVHAIRERLGDDEPGEKPARLLPTSQLRQVIKLAKEEMSRDGVAQVGTDHLLLGLLLQRDSRITDALEGVGLTYRAAREALASVGPEV